jgi:NADPH:quinone reductase-like Zn-dependent oxidoreductase
VLDTVGGQTFLDCFDHVAAYGTVLSVMMSQWPIGLNSIPQFLNLSIVLENMGLPQVAHDHAGRCRQTQILTEAATLFDRHAIKVVVASRYPLADAREAQSHSPNGDTVDMRRRQDSFRRITLLHISSWARYCGPSLSHPFE